MLSRYSLLSNLLDIIIYVAINFFLFLVFLEQIYKWDELEHGSSRWAKNEYAIICCDIIDKVIIKLGEHLALQ